MKGGHRGPKMSSETKKDIILNLEEIPTKTKNSKGCLELSKQSFLTWL